MKLKTRLEYRIETKYHHSIKYNKKIIINMKKKELK